MADEEFQRRLLGLPVGLSRRPKHRGSHKNTNITSPYHTDQACEGAASMPVAGYWIGGQRVSTASAKLFQENNSDGNVLPVQNLFRHFKF